jgi:hypothetical protein
MNKCGHNTQAMLVVVDRDFVTGKIWRLSLSKSGAMEICQENQWSDTLDYALFSLPRQDQAFLLTTDNPHATVSLASTESQAPLLLTLIANHVDQKHHPHNSLMLLLTNTRTGETLVSLMLSKARLSALQR